MKLDYLILQSKHCCIKNIIHGNIHLLTSHYFNSKLLVPRCPFIFWEEFYITFFTVYLTEVELLVVLVVQLKF